MRTIVILLALLSLIACSAAPSTPTPTNALIVPTPASGQAVVVGRILSSITGKPIYRVRVAFAEVLRNEESAIYVDDVAFTPATETDTAGRFVLPDLPPKEYVIVVGDPFGQNDVVRNSDGSPRIWKIEAGQQLDVGELRVKIES